MAANLYIDVATLRNRLGIASDRDVQVLTSAVTAASRSIDAYCGRRFWLDAVASARVYPPNPLDLFEVEVDDFATTAGLIVKTGTDGVTFPTTISNYELRPVNGIGPNGIEGWPFHNIRSISSWFLIPVSYQRTNTVQVTAQWGWAAVPDPVTEACAMIAADLFHLKDNRFGVAGVNDFGPIRVGENRVASGMLNPYRRTDAFLGVA